MRRGVRPPLPVDGHVHRIEELRTLPAVQPRVVVLPPLRDTLGVVRRCQVRDSACRLSGVPTAG